MDAIASASRGPSSRGTSRPPSAVDDLSDNSDEDFDIAVTDYVAAERMTGKALYLQLCDDMGLRPVSNFVDKITLAAVNVQFHGIEHDMAHAMAEALKTNQFIRSFDVSDNRLTDKGGLAIARALEVNTALEDLKMDGCVLTRKTGIEIAQLMDPSHVAVVPVPMSDEELLAQSLKRREAHKAKIAAQRAASARGAEDPEPYDMPETSAPASTPSASGGAAGERDMLRVPKSNSTLRTLSLARNSLGNGFALALAEAVQRNATLTELNVSKCEITGEGAEAVGTALGVNRGLRVLDWSWNDLHEPRAVALIEGLKTSDLQIVDLSYCGMTDPLGIALGATIRSNDSITSLDVSHNRLGKEAALAVAEALPENEAIKALRMGFNPIGYDATKALIAAMERNHTVTILGLENSLTCMDMVPRDFAKEAREKAEQERLAKEAAEAAEGKDKKGGDKGKGKGKGKGKDAGGAEEVKEDKPIVIEPKPQTPSVEWCYDQAVEVNLVRERFVKVLVEFPDVGPRFKGANMKVTAKPLQHVEEVVEGALELEAAEKAKAEAAQAAADAEAEAKAMAAAGAGGGDVVAPANVR